MDFNEYQQQAERSSVHLGTSRELFSMAGLGIAGEAGEVADLIKKWLYHNHPIDKKQMIKELGDVLWYIAKHCTLLNISMEEIAEENIAKLMERYPEGFSAERSRDRKEQ